jgi:hypothetical protein
MHTGNASTSMLNTTYRFEVIDQALESTLDILAGSRIFLHFRFACNVPLRLAASFNISLLLHDVTYQHRPGCEAPPMLT